MKISIVMTVFNVEQYLEKAISSVLNSTLKEIELIIVNDKTPDSSMSIVESFNDDRVKVINHEFNQGAGMARRHGIQAATGEYVITVDGDDYISETFLEDLYNKAIETDADIVGGGITYVYDDKPPVINQMEESISEDMQKFLDYNKGKIIFLNNKIVRRSLYDKVEYCGRIYCEDTPTIIPLMYYANKIAYIKNNGYFYYMRDSSLTHSLKPLKDNLYKALCAKDCIEFFKDKESQYRNIIPLNQMLYHVYELKKLNLSKEDIEPYKDDFVELSLYVINLLNCQ